MEIIFLGGYCRVGIGSLWSCYCKIGDRVLQTSLHSNYCHSRMVVSHSVDNWNNLERGSSKTEETVSFKADLARGYGIRLNGSI